MKPPLSEYLDVYFPGTYTLQDDGLSCDLDECATDLHGCSYQCQNMPNGKLFVIFVTRKNILRLPMYLSTGHSTFVRWKNLHSRFLQ